MVRIFQKYYLDDYDRQVAITDFDLNNNLVISKSYNVINDNMQIEQHTPYNFQVTNYYYYDQLLQKTSLSGGELQKTDSVYVEFNKPIDETSLNLISMLDNGVIISTINSFEDSENNVNSNVVRLSFFNVAIGSYNLRINKEFKSITQRRIPLSNLITEVNFSVIEEIPPS